jgi:hypothetical protein
MQALMRNRRTCRLDEKGELQAAETASKRVPMQGTGADRRVVAMKLSNANRAKASGYPGSSNGQPQGGMNQ